MSACTDYSTLSVCTESVDEPCCTGIPGNAGGNAAALHRRTRSVAVKPGLSFLTGILAVRGVCSLATCCSGDLNLR